MKKIPSPKGKTECQVLPVDVADTPMTSHPDGLITLFIYVVTLTDLSMKHVSNRCL